MNEQCVACDRCPEDRVLAAAKRILCKEYQHETRDELDLDANMVAKALMANAPLQTASGPRASLQAVVGREETCP